MSPANELFRLCLFLLLLTEKSAMELERPGASSDVTSDMASLALSDPSSSAKQTNAAVCHVVDFDDFKDLHVNDDDISRLFKLQGSSDAAIGEGKYRFLAIDVETVTITDETKTGSQSKKVPQRITLVDARGEMVYDEVVSDWALEKVQVERNKFKKKYKFTSGENSSGHYNFYEKMNVFREDNQERLLKEITRQSTEKVENCCEDQGWSKVEPKRKQQNERKQKKAAAEAAEKLRHFVADKTGEAARMLKKAELSDEIHPVVTQFMESFGKRKEQIQTDIRAILESATEGEHLVLVGHDLEQDVACLRDGFDFQINMCRKLDTQMLYRDHVDIEERPSLKLLAEKVLFWHIQQTDSGLHSKHEKDEVEGSKTLKGYSMHGHSSWEDARATMLLLLTKVNDLRNSQVRALTVDTHDAESYMQVLLEIMEAVHKAMYSRRLNSGWNARELQICKLWLEEMHIKVKIMTKQSIGGDAVAEYERKKRFDLKLCSITPHMVQYVAQYFPDQGLEDGYENIMLDKAVLDHDAVISSFFKTWNSQEVKQKFAKDGYRLDHQLYAQYQDVSTPNEFSTPIHVIQYMWVNFLTLDASRKCHKDLANDGKVKLSKCEDWDGASGEDEIELPMQLDEKFIRIPTQIGVLTKIATNTEIQQEIYKKAAKYKMQQIPRYCGNLVTWTANMQALPIHIQESERSFAEEVYTHIDSEQAPKRQREQTREVLRLMRLEKVQREREKEDGQRRQARNMRKVEGRDEKRRQAEQRQNKTGRRKKKRN